MASQTTRGVLGKKIDKNKTGDEAGCGLCGKEVLEKGIECEVCERWFHSKCEGIISASYEALQKDKTLHWYCSGCKGVVLSEKKVREMEEKLEKELSRIKEEINGLRIDRERIGKLEEELKREREHIKKIEEKMGILEAVENISKEEIINVKKVNNVLKDSFAQIVAKQKEETIRDEANKTKKEEIDIREKMIELMEIEKRKENLIFIGIREFVNEREEINEVERLLDALSTESKVSFKIMGRVGKGEVQAGVKDTERKPRPLRICIHDAKDRRRILSRGKNLKMTEDRNIYLVPDLTRKQQAEDKILRDKLKEIRLSGNSSAKIYKGEIVGDKEGVSVVLYNHKL